MAKIIINRKSGFMHRLRKFDVYVDEVKAGAVKNGGAEEIMVAGGHHTVYCKLSWYGSNRFELDLKENDIKFLEVKSGTRFFPLIYFMMLAVLIGPLVFRNASWYNHEWLEWSCFLVLGLVILYGAYYSFFARDKYLRIGEDKKNIFSS
jgi:hypothetical protein